MNAQAAFIKALDLSYMFENLTAAGDKPARAIVADVARTPRRCPAFTITEDGDTTRMSLFPLTVPRLGDASAGIRVVGRTTDPTTTVHAKVVVVARRGVLVTLVIVALTRPDQHELETVAARAVRKLERIT
jgi:hypothetical protein